MKYCHLITPEASRIASLDLSSLLWSVFRYLCLLFELDQLLGGLGTPVVWLYVLCFPDLGYNHALSPLVAAWIYHVLRCGDFAISPKDTTVEGQPTSLLGGGKHDYQRTNQQAGFISQGQGPSHPTAATSVSQYQRPARPGCCVKC